MFLKTNLHMLNTSIYIFFKKLTISFWGKMAGRSCWPTLGWPGDRPPKSPISWGPPPTSARRRPRAGATTSSRTCGRPAVSSYTSSVETRPGSGATPTPPRCTSWYDTVSLHFLVHVWYCVSALLVMILFNAVLHTFGDYAQSLFPVPLSNVDSCYSTPNITTLHILVWYYFKNALLHRIGGYPLSLFPVTLAINCR